MDGTISGNSGSNKNKIFNRNLKWFILIFILISTVATLSFSVSKNTPEEHYINNLKVIHQPDDISCGPTSIAILLDYYNINKTIDDIKLYAITEWFELKDKKIGMTDPKQMEIALNKCGLKSISERGTLDRLKEVISKDKPVIVLLRSGQYTWHYVVVSGYDKNNIIIIDPIDGEIKLDIIKFEQAWKFTHDMDGIDHRVNCPVCNGTGKTKLLQAQCDICFGNGKILDWSLYLAFFIDIPPNLMIYKNENIL